MPVGIRRRCLIARGAARIIAARMTSGLCSMTCGGIPGIGAWRSLVAHLLWEQRVGGSNPSAPTTVSKPAVNLQKAPVAQLDRASAF